jgi:dTDP-glucose 4,6-dehydratase
MEDKKTILVSGGAGFIGSNFILNWVLNNCGRVVNFDLLTYAGNLNNLKQISSNENYCFVQGDVCDKNLILETLKKYDVDAVFHFAAESHVDRSIADPGEFLRTNIMGTFGMLEASRHYWEALGGEKKKKFRFLHISTDEIYGSLELLDPAFTENHAYEPNSPYSASKASSNHLVRAWFHTYGLPILTTNCSNNYGPFQFPEKLIPLMIVNALHGKKLPIYGDGKNIRDWLFVEDHCVALRQVFTHGTVGECYNIGGNQEKTNVEVVQTICALLDKMVPLEDKKLFHPDTGLPLKSYAELISFVTDRPGHDRRYAINATKIKNELHWSPKESFDSGILKTVEWYIKNLEWVEQIVSGEYRHA